jgi:hypothetical protein
MQYGTQGDQSGGSSGILTRSDNDVDKCEGNMSQEERAGYNS